MLQSQGLRFNYTGGGGFEFPDIQCQSGEDLLILGESGVGKTTLLHLLGGLLKPHAGSIIVGDADIVPMKEGQLDRFRGKYIGIIFQQSHFVKSLSVVDNLRLAQYLPGVGLNGERAQYLLERLNLIGKEHKKPHKLSVGEQQRVAIARAVMNRPQLLLADEPTAALDDKNCEAVIHLLQEQAAEANASLVIVTHDNRLKSIISNQIILS